MQDLEVQIAALRCCRWLGNFFGVLSEFPAGFRSSVSWDGTRRKVSCYSRGRLLCRSRKLGKIEQSEEEVFVYLDRHLLEEYRRILEVGDAVGLFDGEW